MAAEARFRLPRAPVFGWSNFERTARHALPSVDTLAHRAFTTSGRAALYHALLLLELPPGSDVLVPTYHCPTIVAPVLCAGMRPRFFGINGSGVPDLASIELNDEAMPRALIAAHYFGLPQSMAPLRRWCDEHAIALIEDCAHSYFGQAGERRIGAWGDFATASVSKFFPVPEAGVLASASRALAPLALRRPGLRAQLKGLIDVVEFGTHYGSFGALNGALEPLLRWKSRKSPITQAEGTIDPSPEAEEMLVGCDMGRIAQAPLWVSSAIVRRLPRERIVAHRRANFSGFLERFRDAPGARPLFVALPDHAAPYVFPLWVDDARRADRVYHALRASAAPVFRWDHVWPTTPALPGDHGRLWNTHVLQLLCHQDLGDDDIERVARTIRHLLGASPQAPDRP